MIFAREIVYAHQCLSKNRAKKVGTILAIGARHYDLRITLYQKIRFPAHTHTPMPESCARRFDSPRTRAPTRIYALTDAGIRLGDWGKIPWVFIGMIIARENWHDNCLDLLAR